MNEQIEKLIPYITKEPLYDANGEEIQVFRKDRFLVSDLELKRQSISDELSKLDLLISSSKERL